MTAHFAAPSTRSVPQPVRSLPAAQQGESFTIGLIMVPQFDMLSLTAALGPLKAANDQMGRDVFQWRLLSWDGAPVPCSEGWSIAADGAVETDDTADITLVCAGDQAEQNMPATLPDHIRKLWRRGHAVGGLGSGAFVLARSGILAGRRFTVHWEHLPIFQTRWPHLEPSAGLYCHDGRIYTCAGGVAAADMTLQLVYERCGIKIGHDAMHACLITARRAEGVSQISAIASRVQCRNMTLVKAVAWIEENFLAEDCLEGLADVAGASGLPPSGGPGSILVHYGSGRYG